MPSQRVAIDYGLPQRSARRAITQMQPNRLIQLTFRSFFALDTVAADESNHAWCIEEMISLI
jgi:hypothetical protein